MKSQRLFLMVLVLAGAVASAYAQPAGDPFGAGAESPAGDPFGGAAAAGEDPFGGAGAPAPVAPAPKAFPDESAEGAAPEPQLPAEEHPLLQALRETNPTTPAQLFRAVTIAMNEREYVAAKGFLQQLQAANLDRDALAALVDQFGSPALVRLGRTEEMAPEGRQFALAALEASQAAATDPARLRELAEQVNDPSVQVRRAAVRELQQAGPAAVAPLIEVLTDPMQRDVHAAARAALYYLGRPAVEPLLGVLEAPDAAIRAQAMQALGALRAEDAVLRLVGPAVNPREDAAVRQAAGVALERITGRRPHPEDARRLLAREIEQLLDGELPRQADADGTIELWRWDAEQGAAVPRRYPARLAGTVVAARLADALYAISQEREGDAARRGQARSLYLQALLQAAKLEAGLDLPLPRGEGTAHAQAAALGAAAVEDALQEAIQAERLPAAIAAAEVLGDVGSPAQVHSGTARPAPLVAALSHKNQRLRMAAAEAIARIDPQTAFPNASRYIDTLQRLARTEALPRVLVAHPRGEVAQSLAGLLVQMGFEAETAATGRQAYELAARHPDFAFLLLSDALDDPPAGPLVELLRQDLRTANLPIAVMYRIEIEPLQYTEETGELLEAAVHAAESLPGLRYKPERMLAARRIALGDPQTIAAPQVADAASLDFVVRQLAAAADGDLITPRERIYFAQVALEALGRYVADPVKYAFYQPAQVEDALVKAVDQAELALYAVDALGKLGSARAQLTLVDAASQNTRPIEVRQAAAAAFREAVARQHLQLTTKEILLQYDRYNLSEHLDRPTQVVLGHVLDTIEGIGREAPVPAPPDVKESAPSS